MTRLMRWDIHMKSGKTLSFELSTLSGCESDFYHEIDKGSSETYLFEAEESTFFIVPSQVEAFQTTFIRNIEEQQA